MREDFQHLLGVAHIFLHAKVGYPQIEVQRCRGFELKKMLRPSSLLPLFIPVFLAQMRRSTDLALSLELRGVSGEALVRGARLTVGAGDLLFVVAAALVWLGPISLDVIVG